MGKTYLKKDHSVNKIIEFRTLEFAYNLCFWAKFAQTQYLVSKKYKNEHHHHVLYIRISNVKAIIYFMLIDIFIGSNHQKTDEFSYHYLSN